MPIAWWKYAYTSVVEEYIRPWSWERIRDHRQRYRHYRDRYKQYLRDRARYRRNHGGGGGGDDSGESEALGKQLQELEDLEKYIDLANILMAREEAKLEVGSSTHLVRKSNIVLRRKLLTITGMAK